jgi:hypothetical protein
MIPQPLDSRFAIADSKFEIKRPFQISNLQSQISIMPCPKPTSGLRRFLQDQPFQKSLPAGDLHHKTEAARTQSAAMPSGAECRSLRILALMSFR